MIFKGTVTVNASREKVWKFLTTPEQLTECAPGLESLEVITPNEKFRAVASIGFGAVKATFVTDVTWMDLDPPNRARMKIQGTAPGSRGRHERDGPQRRSERCNGAGLVVGCDRGRNHRQPGGAPHGHRDPEAHRRVLRVRAQEDRGALSR